MTSIVHIEAPNLPQDAEASVDVCIVGAGAAGISLAMELEGSDLQVALLESGTFGPDPRAQRLNRGEIGEGLSHAPLEEARFRTVGGTTSQWGGGCLPYDPLDFEPRADIDRIGWPLRRTDLDPYYARAAAYVEIGEPTFDASALRSPERPEAIDGLGATGAFTTRYWRTGPPTRFGERYGAALVASTNVRLITGATATHLGFNGRPDRVERIEVRTLEGRRHYVRARAYVLAMGGLEVPRLLLASTQAHPHGVGNDHDLVGRFYSPHINVTHGIVVLGRGVRGHARYEKTTDGTDLRRFITVTEGAQKAHRLLNCKITLENVADVPHHPLTHEVAGVVQRRAYRPPGMRGRLFDAAKRMAPAGAAESVFALNAAFEQVPNPESRVVLTSHRDQLGTPKLRLHHKILPIDLASAVSTYGLLGRTLGELGLGRLHYDASGKSIERAAIGVSHHTGTTRMATSASAGVVDADARVFGVENLFVASASVFPTSGHANPTFTIVALALRLADRLQEELHA